MSYSTDRYSLENAKLNDIVLTTCGITKNHPGHTAGKRIYNDYSLHFITKGEGEYIINEKRYHLKRGEGFLILPGVLNEYIGDRSDPWEYVYIGFSGNGSERIITDMGLNKDNPVFAFSEDIIPDIYLMHAAGKNKALKGYGILGRLFLVISRLVTKGASLPQWSPESYVKKAKQYICDNFVYDINVKNVAEHIGIDRTYLFRLFKIYEKTTPSAYILKKRLESAAVKLRETDAPITEIALSSGFNDVPHFYKAFCNKFKISPKKYREETQ